MELNEYQEKAMETCLPTCDNFSYMVLNLFGEVGEFAGKIAKQIRKNNLKIEGNHLHDTFSVDDPEVDKLILELKHEAGDCIWMLAGICQVLGWNLEDIAQMNLNKLQGRKRDNTIDGDGDHR